MGSGTYSQLQIGGNHVTFETRKNDDAKKKFGIFSEKNSKCKKTRGHGKREKRGKGEGKMGKEAKEGEN